MQEIGTTLQKQDSVLNWPKGAIAKKENEIVQKAVKFLEKKRFLLCNN